MSHSKPKVSDSDLPPLKKQRLLNSNPGRLNDGNKEKSDVVDTQHVDDIIDDEDDSDIVDENIDENVDEDYYDDDENDGKVDDTDDDDGYDCESEVNKACLLLNLSTMKAKDFKTILKYIRDEININGIKLSGKKDDLKNNCIKHVKTIFKNKNIHSQHKQLLLSTIQNCVGGNQDDTNELRVYDHQIIYIHILSIPCLGAWKCMFANSQINE